MSSTDTTTAPEGAERRPSLYANVLRAICETPWAIRPEMLAVILDVVQMRAAGVRFTSEEVEQRIGAAQAARAARGQRAGGTVAVLPIYGVITPRADLFTQMSGGTSLESFQAMFKQAVGDPEIGSILLDVDSPGGTVDLVPETAALIRSSRGEKPIVALANTDAASAAYWLASQADELVVTTSGSVGSIGVFAAHDDISGAQDKLGVKTTLISAGRYKVEGNPYEPLTDEARAAIQESVDEFYGMFVADVAKGRGVSASDVRAGFGEGRMVSARNAVKAGMADKIDTFDGTLARMLRGSFAASPKKASATEDEIAVASGFVTKAEVIENEEIDGEQKPAVGQEEAVAEPEPAKSPAKGADPSSDWVRNLRRGALPVGH